LKWKDISVQSLRIFTLCIFFSLLSLSLLSSSVTQASTTKDYAKVQLEKGALLYEGGNLEEARKIWNKGLEWCEQHNDPQGESAFLYNLGKTHYECGEYGIALDFFSRARTLAPSGELKSSFNAALINSGAVYFSLGQHSRALECFEKALNNEIDRDSKKYKALLLRNMGLVYDAMGDYEKALEYGNKSLDEMERKKEDSARAHILLASIQYHQNNYDDAILHLKRSLKTSSKQAGKDIQGIALTGLGLIYSAQGKYQESLDMHREALAIFTTLDDQDGQYRNYAGIGCAYEDLDKKDLAIRFYKESIKIIEAMRSNLKIEEQRIQFMTDKMSIYERLIHLLLVQKSGKEAFHYAEKAKARAFLDMLCNVKVSARNRAYPELIIKEQELNQKIRALKIRLAHVRESLVLKHCRTELSKLQNEYEENLEALKTSNPDYASLISVHVADLVEIQRSLPAESLLLEYFVGKKFSFLFVIDKESFQVSEIPCAEEELQDKIASLRLSIMAKGSWEEQGKKLSTMLLGDRNSYIENRTGKKKKILIVPHSALHYMPFSLLSDSRGKLLLQHFQIVTLPSASIWELALNKKEMKKDKIATFALGNLAVSFQQPEENAVALRGSLLLTGEKTRDGLMPLPGTEKEADVIAGIFKENTLLKGRDMTYENVREALKGKDIVHFATHGILDSTHPLFSGLVMADRMMSVTDIMELDLHARLIVLSACETAGGEITRGDEIVGMSRAFLYAGSPRVIASLWNVSDNSTASLMQSFYRNLKSGRSESLALQEAQMSLMKKYPHPFYWAPFILIGDCPECDSKKKSLPDAMVCVAIILLASLIIVSIMKRNKNRSG
jgi:CHAT domain-containing protein/predicted negative regulator of RcsB-dependent stress response